MYDITRTLSGKYSSPSRTVKDKSGNLLSSEGDQRARRAEHFKETLNRPAPQTPPTTSPPTELLGINTNPPSRIEISRAIKSLKTGKAAGPDGIPPEALKANTQTSTEMLYPLLNKVWEQEQVLEDWKKEHMVKLPKKGDVSSCNIWRGFKLLSIPGKVLTRIIHVSERLKTALDKKLLDEQAGFHQDRSCTDHIATMRIIIEQWLEWQSPLYSVFVDFQKAFDSIDREAIWKLIQHYGFPPKFVTIIQQLYENATCQVIHEGKLTEPFVVQTGVRQGCLLTATIFLIVIDWVTRKAKKDRRLGIHWTLPKQLEDLDFSDDISLLAHWHEDAQTKLKHVADEAEKVGLQININKTEVMRVNNNRQQAIQLRGKEIKEADSFTYLGSVVSKDGGNRRRYQEQNKQSETCFQHSTTHLESNFPLSTKQN